MAFKDESSTFLGEVGVRERVNWRRSGTVLLAALAVFGVSSFSARALFPRGVKGRVPPSSTEQAMEVVPPAKDFAIGNEAEGLSTLAPGMLARSLIPHSALSLCESSQSLLYRGMLDDSTLAVLIRHQRKVNIAHEYCWTRTYSPSVVQYYTQCSNTREIRFVPI